MTTRATVQPRQFKNALITVDEDKWYAYKRLQRERGTSASARIRRMIERELRLARRRGEM